MKLEEEEDNITEQYTEYVSLIRESLQKKGVTVRDLVFNLMSLPAFNRSEQHLKLLCTHKTELKGARDLYDVLGLLKEEYASFLDYKIFKFIVKKYSLDEGQDAFKYPEYLKAYVERHKITEFMDINPQLERLTGSSKPLVLKFDIDYTSKLARIKKLKSAVAKILGLKSAALQLLDIKKGCVEVTFKIPAPVAVVLLQKSASVNEKQLKELSIIWLKCNEVTLYSNEKYQR